jgi:hypothetical protein
MKKKILITASILSIVVLGGTTAFLLKNRFKLRQSESRNPARAREMPAADADKDQLSEKSAYGGEVSIQTRRAAPQGYVENEQKEEFFADARTDAGGIALGKVFTPATNPPRPAACSGRAQQMRVCETRVSGCG